MIDFAFGWKCGRPGRGGCTRPPIARGGLLFERRDCRKDGGQACAAEPDAEVAEETAGASVADDIEGSGPCQLRVTVSSRLSSVLATIVWAASSAAGSVSLGLESPFAMSCFASSAS
jgi:hypothetical protein